MSRRGGEHYHTNIGHIFRKYFTKVEGARGYYVLNEAITGRRLDGAWTSRTKEDVVHRHFKDDVYLGDRTCKLFVYRRDDGTEFIDQRRRRPVTRIDGRAMVEMHCYTAHGAMSGLQWLESMRTRLDETP